MIESFKRFRLQKKGLSCGKKRREREVGCFREFVRCSPAVTGILLALSGFFLGWIVLYRPGFGVPHVDQPTKAMLVMLALFLGLVLQFSSSHAASFQKNSRLLLVLTLLCAHLGLTKLAVCFVEDHGMAVHWKLLLVPYGLAPMALTILLGRGHGIFGTLFVSLWGCMLMPEPRLLAWLVTSLCTGLVTVAASHEVRKRKHALRAGLWLGLVAVLLTTVFGHLRPIDGSLGIESWPALASDAFLVLGLSLATGILVSSLLPLIEPAFRITTAGSWLELADLNHPLLRRMTIEAPGTYHHSLMVANLAEAAAEAIGADSLRTRVCSYFHDIGKLKNPEYFIENQPHDANPHDTMTPSMSALVVLSHVKDGVDLALRHKLNGEIIDVIEQHHGTSLAWYFYQRALARQAELRALADEDKAHETDVPDVDEATFRYPGPKPQSREAAIISLADTLESASRTLEKPTPAKIEQMVDDIVRNRILDGQLDECDLTLGQLDEVKRSFVTTLRSMLHKRVSYAKGEKTADKDAKAPPATKTHPTGATTRFQVIHGRGGDPRPGGKAA